MKQCIYCHKTEEERSFTKSEHVMPRLFGEFENCPTLVELVCDHCNLYVFSPLENRFKEDTEEGVFYQMYNLSNSAQIRIRGKQFRPSFKSNMGSLFDKMIPTFRIEAGQRKVYFEPQIKINNFHGEGTLALLIDNVKKLSGSKRKKLKSRLKGVQSKDVSVFTHGDGLGDTRAHEEAKELLLDLGVKYNQGNTEFQPVDKSQEPVFEISADGAINNDLGRVIAKIAFNYFAKCVEGSGMVEILMRPNFDRVKSFILKTETIPLKDIVTDISYDPVIYEEYSQNVRIVAHVTRFLEENGKIIAEVCFLGTRIYKVLIGDIPTELKRPEFGCGHLFDPTQHGIYGLTQNPAKWGSGFEPGYGLFNRI